MSYSIQKLKSEDINNLIQFNKRIYPQRKNLKHRFLWYFIRNPLIKEEKELNSLLCYSKDKNIIGQILINPIEWFYNKKFEGYYGVDYFVLEECRGIPGAMLAFKAFNEHKPYFGFTQDRTLKIHLELKVIVLGRMEKFIWFRNFSAPIKLLINGLTKKVHMKKNSFLLRNFTFPAIVSTNKFKFILKSKVNHWNDNQWENTLIFSRSKEYIHWRFFDSHRKYFFYKMDETQTAIYFVVRRCYWEGLVLLVIVDYRVPYLDIRSWESILLASKLLAKQMNCDGVITMSSHHFFDKELRNNKFYKVGNESYIVSNAKIEVSNEDIQKKNFIYATMADFDIDLDFGN